MLAVGFQVVRLSSFTNFHLEVRLETCDHDIDGTSTPGFQIDKNFHKHFVNCRLDPSFQGGLSNKNQGIHLDLELVRTWRWRERIQVFQNENYGIDPDVVVFFFGGYLHLNDIFDIFIYTSIQCSMHFISFYYAYMFLFKLFAVLSPRSDTSSSQVTCRLLAVIGDVILKRSPCWFSEG